jgi:hypothetical protein
MAATIYGRDKLVAQYPEHGIQNPLIADAAPAQLHFDHHSAFFFEWQWLGHFTKHQLDSRARTSNPGGIPCQWRFRLP